MLLREPDGNSAQLYNNGNVMFHHQSHQRSWIDNANVSNSGHPNLQLNNSSNSLSYRESQLHAALSNALNFDNAVNSIIAVDNNDCHHINNIVEEENKNSIHPDNLTLDLDQNRVVPSADFSPDEGLFDYEEEEHSYSSSNVSLQEDEKIYDQSISDDSCSNDKITYPIPRGIHNPNYPGFQHLAYTLQEYSIESPNSFENISDISNICDNNYIERDEIRRHKNLNCYANEVNNNNFEYSGSEYISRDNFREGEHIYESFCSNSEQMEIENPSMHDVISADFQNKGYIDEHIMHGSDSDFVSLEDSRDDEEHQEFEDDLIALKKDIYETIQKPIAETLNNISDVVNNVIRQIVEEQDVNNYLLWNNSPDSTRFQNLLGVSFHKLQQDEKLDLYGLNEPQEAHNIDNLIENNNSDELPTDKTENIIERIKVQIDDAYMSNVSEEIEVLQDEGTFDAMAVVEHPLSCNEFKNTDYDINFNKMSHENLSSVAKEDDDIFLGKESTPLTFENDNALEQVNISEPMQQNDDKCFPIIKVNKKKYESRKGSADISSVFDVYNIETAMPLIDLDAIENHLKAAKEEERRFNQSPSVMEKTIDADETENVVNKFQHVINLHENHHPYRFKRRNDREEIRRRLAMGTENDEYYNSGDRPGRKPSLQARLQSGMNLQICFMNETVSDTESPSDVEMNNANSPKRCLKNKISYNDDKANSDNSVDFEILSINSSKKDKIVSGLTRPSSLALSESYTTAAHDFASQADFFECQARLQTEARMALAQAKEIAHMQMEIDRQSQDKSPITEMLRCSLEKAGIKFFGERRRVSRQMLTDINVTQLQVIVNELHTQIEYLNESLVELLIARDELHMGQDSMLVDIEDLTRHLGAKDLSCKPVDPNDKLVCEKLIRRDKFSKNQLRIPKVTPSQSK